MECVWERARIPYCCDSWVYNLSEALAISAPTGRGSAHVFRFSLSWREVNSVTVSPDCWGRPNQTGNGVRSQKCNITIDFICEYSRRRPREARQVEKRVQR